MTIKSTQELRDMISGVLTKVIDGDIASNQANAVSNLIGKFMGTIQLDMKYHAMKDALPKIDIMENNKLIGHDPETGEIEDSSTKAEK